MHPDGMDVGNDLDEAQEYLKNHQELLAKLKVSIFTFSVCFVRRVITK